MNRIFISYSGNRVNRAALFFALREHGLNPWRDVESLELGDDTTETIEEELRGCSGVILWVNEDVLSSAYVKNVELPAIAKRGRQGGFRLVPVFDGMSPTAGSDRLSELGIEVGERNGHVVDPQLRDGVTAAEIARRYARAHVGDARERGKAPVVRLVSYDDTAGLREDAVLNLDWRHQLAGGVLGGLAEQQLRSALIDTTGAIKDSYGGAEITLVVKAHLPLAVALGHAFAEPTGCTLRMPREGGTWEVSRAGAHAAPLKQQSGMRGPADSRAASVEVSISRDIEVGVNAYVGTGRRYRHRLLFSPENGIGRDALTDSESLNAWARQVGDALTVTADRADVDRVDLFLATPVELAVAIGWWTNASGSVEIMNWAGKTGPYEGMWRLP